MQAKFLFTKQDLLQYILSAAVGLITGFDPWDHVIEQITELC